MAGRPLKPLPRPTTPTARLGAELRRRRLAAGLSTQAAAAGVGVVPSAWNHWELGHREPPARRLPAIAAAIGCTAADLLAAMTAPPAVKLSRRRPKV